MLNDKEITEVKAGQREPEREQRVFTFTESKVKHPANFFVGLLLGSLASAVAMFLFAPQSGKETRQKIQQKSIELYDQTTATVQGVLAQVRTKAGQFKSDLTGKAKELKHQGQAVLVEQLDHVSAAAKTGKKTVQGTHS